MGKCEFRPSDRRGYNLTVCLEVIDWLLIIVKKFQLFVVVSTKGKFVYIYCYPVFTELRS